MKAPLLSRFDVVFILHDNPAVDQDSFLASHIISLHHRGAQSGSVQWEQRNRMKKRKAAQVSSQDPVDTSSLKYRLERAATENQDPIPPQLLRKYIAYARK